MNDAIKQRLIYLALRYEEIQRMTRESGISSICDNQEDYEIGRYVGGVAVAHELVRKLWPEELVTQLS